MDDDSLSDLPPHDPAAELQRATVGVKVHIDRFGVRRSLTPEQREITASTFNADSRSLSASKLLIDTQHPAYRGVTAVVNEIMTYVRSATLPFPEKGVRLLPREQLHAFNTNMMTLSGKLRTAAAQLQQHQTELRESARSRLGALFDPEDYPEDMQLEYHLDWELVAVEAPSFLRELSDALWEKERQRTAKRFEVASRLIQGALKSRLKELLAQLTAWLSKQPVIGFVPIPPSMVTRFRKFLAEAQARQQFCDPEFSATIERLQLMVEHLVSDEATVIATWRSILHSDISYIVSSVEATAEARFARDDAADSAQ